MPKVFLTISLSKEDARRIGNGGNLALEVQVKRVGEFTDELAIAGYYMGVSARELGDMYGISHVTVLSRWHKLNLDTAVMPRSRKLTWPGTNSPTSEMVDKRRDD